MFGKWFNQVKLAFTLKNASNCFHVSTCANYAPVRCSTITQVLVTLETKSACHVFSGFSDLIRPTRYRIASNSTSARCPAYHLSVGFGGSWFLVTKIFNERQLKDKKSLNSLCGTKNCFKPSVQFLIIWCKVQPGKQNTFIFSCPEQLNRWPCQ